METKESASLETKNEEKPLLSSMKDKLKIMSSLELPLVSSCYIYKVPPRLRKVNEEAYTPSVISIGPFHHGNKNLESMEELKWWCCHKFMKRTQENLLQIYVKTIRDLEGKIRGCYSEIIPMVSDYFVSMILTDACFIIEFFLAYINQSSEEDTWVFKPWPTYDVILDLILLENQLPFFVLECLFDLTFPTGFNGRSSFVEVAFDTLSALFLHIVVPNEEIHNKFTFSYFEQHLKLPNGNAQVQDLCDMLRIFYLSPDQLPRRKLGIVKHLYSTSQLHEAGLELKVDKHKSIIELHYSPGELTIPYLEVTDWTETLIRNVVAFEQCHLPRSSYVTDYIALLDHLINTGKDVEMLVKKGIMSNFLGDNDTVASMVNNLGKNVALTMMNGEYISLSNKLNKFYDNRCHKYKAIFIREYWSTPWKIASFIAAIILLLLTLIQTICSVISLFQ